MTDLATLSATELLAAYRAGLASPVEATQAVLDRIDRLNPQLNAFCVLDRDGALDAARASEARWRAGTPAGLLDGVPTTIKDVMLMRGFPTLKGSKLTSPDQAWDEDSPVTERLRRHGAVLLGKTTTPELGWKALGDSPVTGITRNPWNLAHTPGGSSAGAAAGLAAGFGALAIGTDGAGSIRIPAAFSGVSGLKPTLGLVPYYPASAMGLLSHCGPMARTVADCALMLNALVGPDPRDPFSLPADDTDYASGIEDGVKGLRIAVSPTLDHPRVDPEIVAAVTRAAARFAALGATVETVERPFELPREALLVLWQGRVAHALAGVTEAQRAALDPGLARTLDEARRITLADYLDAEARRDALGRAMGDFHRRYDLLLTPTVAVPALPVAQDLSDPAHETYWIDWAPFAYPFNLTRQPAASVPCGTTRAGLPIGLQIVGPLHADALVLRAARAFEGDAPYAWAPGMA